MVIPVTPDPARGNRAIEQPAEASQDVVLSLENSPSFPPSRPWEIVESAAQRMQHLTGQSAHRLVAGALVKAAEGLGLEAQILRSRGQRAVKLRRVCPEPSRGAQIRANELQSQLWRLVGSERDQRSGRALDGCRRARSGERSLKEILQSLQSERPRIALGGDEAVQNRQ